MSQVIMVGHGIHSISPGIHRLAGKIYIFAEATSVASLAPASNIFH
jgi:hypothetical protein